MTRLLTLFLLIALFAVVACSAGRSPNADSTTTATEPQVAPAGAAPPPGYESGTWAEIVDEARGQTVTFHMWGGQENINRWVTGYAATALKEQYGIELVQVPVADIAESVNKLVGEAEAGRAEGTVDLLWINGENFATLRQADLLYGPFAQYLPNSQYVDRDDPSVSYDLGLPTDDYESPWGKAHYVMIYDSARVAEPPRSIDGLVAWVKAHPGQFTYPAPPDFTGVGFVLQLCYHATGGHEQFLGDFDQALFDATLPACWALLNEIEPFLWREGATYPESHAAQQNLFANGEVSFDMAWNPSEASAFIEAGRFPESTRTFVFDQGTLSNAHFLAIPANAPHKAAAMVVANFMLSPEAQQSKADIANWGDLPAVSVSQLPQAWQDAFAELPRGVATLPNEELTRKIVPELPAPWRVAIEEGWQREVLQK
ncbi:MAG: ABC transporter substrate-binding protein [Anaerolineales bacterium]|nr:ABC transporter substrate-binding protein [Anaerolineales bacterium]MCB9126777.1 ABC transporter substrate-binding protein [Ardenticatenales bacterium]MCB9172636.1 ABC transporter substrate-binding protein [Ardenticatenales bacterium]